MPPDADFPLYIEHRPSAPLSSAVEMLWYARGYDSPQGFQRVFPNGALQVIINLASDYTVDCRSLPTALTPGSLIIGVHSESLLIDTADLAEIMGFQFWPGGFARFAKTPAGGFLNDQVALDCLWGAAASHLRDQLREAPNPVAKLRLLEYALLDRAAGGSADLHPAVACALRRFHPLPDVTRIAGVARETGLSRRRFTHLFREQVGITPKLYCRIRRFRQTVQQLNTSQELDWSALALACGYFDQSHFSNDFHAFTGINPTTYLARRTRWSGHVAIETGSTA